VLTGFLLSRLSWYLKRLFIWKCYWCTGDITLCLWFTSRCPGWLGRLFLAFTCVNRPANDYDNNIVVFPHTSQWYVPATWSHSCGGSGATRTSTNALNSSSETFVPLLSFSNRECCVATFNARTLTTTVAWFLLRNYRWTSTEDEEPRGVVKKYRTRTLNDCKIFNDDDDVIYW